MADDQRHGHIFGVLFIITFITSIAALALFQPVLDDPVGYIDWWREGQPDLPGCSSSSSSSSSRTSERPSFSTRSRGGRTRPSPSATSERESSSASSSRRGSSSCSESWACGTIFRPPHDAAFTLAALKDWTFLFGPGMIVPLGNGLILGYLMYKSGLVPRRMAWLGLIGGPAPLHFERRHARSSGGTPAALFRASWSSRSSSGRRSSGSTARSGDSGRTLRLSDPTGAATPQPHEYRFRTYARRLARGCDQPATRFDLLMYLSDATRQ